MFPKRSLSVLAYAGQEIDYSKPRIWSVTRYVSAPYFGEEKVLAGAVAHIEDNKTGNYKLASLQVT